MIHKSGPDIDLTQTYDIQLWCDGSADNVRGGRIAWGGVIVFGNGARWLLYGKDDKGGTSPFAELMAIHDVLAALPKFIKGTIKLYSDSEWAIRCLTGEYRRQKFLDTWIAVEDLLADLPDVDFIHVRGHRGIHENELCHTIADYVRRLGSINLETL